MMPRPVSSVPASVAALDAVLNAYVLNAASDVELRHWLTEKLAVKRRLVAVADAHLDGAASAELRRLHGPVR